MTQIELIGHIDACMKKFRGERLHHQLNAGAFLPDEFPPHLTREAEAAEIVTIVRKSDPLVLNLIEATEAARNYIDGQMDVVDGDYGVPAPNQAMSIASQIDEALAPWN